MITEDRAALVANIIELLGRCATASEREFILRLLWSMSTADDLTHENRAFLRTVGILARAGVDASEGAQAVCLTTIRAWCDEQLAEVPS